MRKALSKEVRERVKNRFGMRCGYCGELQKKIHIDHIIPVCISHQQGKEFDCNDESNLMPSCFSCNNYKNVHSLEFFRRELSEQVKRAEERSINFRLAKRFFQICIQEHPIVFYFEKEKP